MIIKENNKISKIKMKSFIFGAIFAFAIVILFTSIYKLNTFYEKFDEKDKDRIISKVEEIISNIDYYYVNEADKEKMIDGLYKGLVAGVNDPYTTYFNRDDFKIFTEETEGTYAGIGVVVQTDTKDKLIRVAGVFEDSPAQEAGMLLGDKIIKVNGEDVIDEPFDVIVSKIKGKINTTVDIGVLRDTDTVNLTVERRKINIPTVAYKMLDNNIAYLKIISFDQITMKQFHKAYNDILTKNPKGLILDLRNNPGGLLETVIDIADTFLPEGLIMYTEDKSGKRITYNSKEGSFNKPLVVLVNENSASASEVLAGAIKAHKVGKLVGTTTFGKGVVQKIFPLKDYTALKITISKYFTPDNVCIQDVGIKPNVEVVLPDELKKKVILTEDEDIQLKKAIEILNQ